MSIKSNYFKLNKDDFDKYLDDLKRSSNSIHLLDEKFFFNQSVDISNMLITLNKKIVELDFIINSLTEFSKKQIIQSFMIDEIESTNKIENIFSTRHDIFKIINDISKSKEKKVISIANAYKHLLGNEKIHIKSCQDIRNIYDIVLKGAIEKEDLPDGIYFRHGIFYATNGIKNVHTGIIGEENVNRLMNEFINFYNSNIDIEYAYKLLENEKMPGWLYMAINNTTTIWEGWEGINSQSGIASLNHYSKGAMVKWLFSGMCGINIVKENVIAVKPLIGGHVTYAKCNYKSIYGNISVYWKKENGKITININVPANVVVLFEYKDKKEELYYGEYTFTF